MLVNLSINLFNKEKVTTFSEKEYGLQLLHQNKFSKSIAINHFKDFVFKFERFFNEEQFQFYIDEKLKFIEMSYFTNSNNTEYFMKIEY